MPDFYEQRRRSRWLYELAGIPVDEPVSPTYEDLRIAQAGGGVPSIHYDEWKPPEDRAEEIAEDQRRTGTEPPVTGDEKPPPPESAPQATARGEQTTEEDVRATDEELLGDGLRTMKEGAATRLPPDQWPAINDDPRLVEAHFRRAGLVPMAQTSRSLQLQPPSGPLGPSPEERAQLAREREVDASVTGDREDPWEALTRMREELRTTSATPAPHVVFNPFEARTRARELYGEDTPAPTSRRWEEEFLRMHDQPQSDSDIRRQAMFKAFFGDKGADEEFRRTETLRQQRYQEGLAQARERDREEAMRDMRVPRGLAQAIAASGLVDPEDAIKLRMSDPVVKAFVNGAYQFGSGIRRTDLQSWLQELGINARTLLALGGQQTQRDVAETRAATLSAERAARTPPPSTPSREASWVAADANVSQDIGRLAASDGDLSTLPAAIRAAVEKSRERWRAMSPTEQSAALTAQTKGEARDRDVTVTRSRDPKLNIDQRLKFDAVAIPWRQGYEAMTLLGQQKKLDVMTHYGTDEFSTELKNMGLTGEQANAASAIGQLMDAYRKGSFGVTLTDNELRMLQEVTGVRYGSGVAFWTHPSRIVGFMNRMGEVLRAHEELLNQNLDQRPYGEP